MATPTQGNSCSEGIVRKVVLFAGAVIAVACSQPTGAPTTGPASLVIVRPSADTVSPGQTMQFVDTVEDANGRVLSGQTVVWGTGNSAVAKISVTGLATAVAPGTTTIQAASGGVSGNATLVVVANSAPTSESFVFDKDTLVPFGVPYDISQHVHWVLKNSAGDSVGASALASVSAVAYYPVLGNSTPGTCAVLAGTFIAYCPDGGWPTVGTSAYQYNGYWSVTVHAKSVSGVPDQHNTIFWYVNSNLPGSQPLYFSGKTAAPITELAGTPVNLAPLDTFQVQTAQGQTVATVPVASIVSDVFGNDPPGPIALPGDPAGCTINGLTITCSESGNQYLELVDYNVVVTTKPSSFNGIANPAYTDTTNEIDVSEPPPPTVTIIPALDTLEVGDSVLLVVDTLTPSGNELPVASSTVQWINGSPQVDTVSQSGMVYALSPGTAQTEAGVTPASGSDNQNFGIATIVVIPSISGAHVRAHVVSIQRSVPITPVQRRQLLSDAARLLGQRYPLELDSLRAVRPRSESRGRASNESH